MNIQRVKQVRKLLTIDACKIIMCGLVLSHLDYSNAILAGLPKCSINKLQRVQNIAAKLVLNRHKFDSSTECLKELHWLPIRLRIEYKIVILVHKCLNGQAPNYLMDLLRTRTSCDRSL